MSGVTICEARPEHLPGAREHILRAWRDDLGLAYDPSAWWAHDVDHLDEVYLQHPRRALFVALDDESGAVVGTSAVREGGPHAPPHPDWLAARYHPTETAQLFRVYVDPRYQRRGIARRLVEAARGFVARVPDYRVIYLHTNATVPGAEPFWRAMPTVEVYDDRGERPGYPRTVHFELAIPARG